MQRKKFGQLLNPAMLWARVPGLFLGVAFFNSVFSRKNSLLEAPLRSLVMVRVSQINHCKFCVDLNSYLLLKKAGSTNKLDELFNWKESEAFDERERVALEYAEAMTYSDRKVSDELFSRLREGFDDDAIVELTGLIAFQNLSSKFNSALDVPSQGFCKR